MIAVDYLQSCGSIGLQAAEEVLCRVQLDVDVTYPSPQTDGDVSLDGADESMDTIIPNHLVRFCQEHNRQWILDRVVKVSSP